MPDYTEHATNSVAAYLQIKHVDRLAPLKSLVMAFSRNKCTFLGLVSLTVKRQPRTHTILSKVSGAVAQVLLQLYPQAH